MVTSRANTADQAIDIAGTLYQTDTLHKPDEPLQLGRKLITGSTASITGSSPNMTVTGLFGMTPDSEGLFLNFFGTASPGNTGCFEIITYISPTSVVIFNVVGIGGDANNGSISYELRLPWTAEEDHNFHRTDRTDIKGVSYYDPVPTYTRPDATNVNVPANLANIAGKTTDAKPIITDQRFVNIPMSVGDSSFMLISPGNLKWADNIDTLGVPIFDGYDIGNWNATFVEVTDSSNREIVVDGYRIFGIAYGGSGTSPDSFEVVLMQVLLGQDISTSVPYTWSLCAPTMINGYYPYRDRLDQMEDSALRNVLINGVTGSPPKKINIYSHLFMFMGA
jgi:hypothetical protein